MHIMFTINILNEIRVMGSYGGLFEINKDTNFIAIAPVTLNTNKSLKGLINSYKNYSHHLQNTTFIGYIKVNNSKNGVLLAGQIQKMLYEENIELNITHYADYYCINGDMNDTDNKEIINNAVKIKYKTNINKLNIDSLLRDVKIQEVLS